MWEIRQQALPRAGQLHRTVAVVAVRTGCGEVSVVVDVAASVVAVVVAEVDAAVVGVDPHRWTCVYGVPAC